MQWETVIGLEIHTQLATQSKIFSGASTAYGAEPNSQACAVDLGLPGVLPVINREAVHMAIKFGLAIDAEIADVAVFDRKNYFYPDLPKGYQISQLDYPIVGRGRVDIELADGKTRTIGVTRAHLEEDAGKSLHKDYQGMSGIDLNRAGTPLIEIVSEPDMRSAAEAVAYMRKIYQIVTYLGICDGNLQEGSFRCDANVSVRPLGSTAFGTRTELKNINSFRFVERAILHEAARQIDLLEDGHRIVQETRLYDADRDETRSMRSKEEANDYRYFPDPDLLPVRVDREWLESIRSELPEMPDQRRQRFIQDYSLGIEEARLLTSDRATADYFEQAVAISNDARTTANLMSGELSAHLNREGLEIGRSPVTASQLGQLVTRISDGTISSKIAKQVLESLWKGEAASADEIIDSQGLKQMSDSGELESLVEQVLADNPGQVEQYRAGKTKLMGFFVGQIMKQTSGRANPQQLNSLLKQKLED